MAEARDRSEWERASLLASMIHNGRYGLKRSDMRPPAFFNPYERKRDDKAMVVPPSVGFAAMRQAFVKTPKKPKSPPAP